MTWVKTAEVTFSGSSAVNIDGCFSATYTHYMVTRNLLGSGAGNYLDVRLRVSGSDDSGTNYRQQYVWATSTSISGARATGQTYWGAAFGATEATAIGYGALRISNPFEAVRTTAWADMSTTATGNIDLYRFVYAHDATTSYTSMSVIPRAGTVTGTIRVFGLKES